MDVFEALGIKPYINAHDTYTVYGGSRMSAQTLAAMAEISARFVDFAQLQRVVGESIAKMTRNEAAFVTNGAAGAMQLAAAVCMSSGDAYRYMRLPQTDGRNRFVVIHAQHNAYDKAIAAAGGERVLVGDADETLEEELRGVIGPDTAAVLYFVNKRCERASMPLENVIRIAHERDVPVIVDAAAQLPPVENLWTFTAMGADMVIFSGGKTLCGPQDSGLIVGKEALIQDCHRFGAPAHGVCRGCKTSREAVVGLWSALCQYLAMDHEENDRRMMAINRRIQAMVKGTDCVTRIVSYGPVGQAYPRLFMDVHSPKRAALIADRMREQGIYIGCDEMDGAVYVSPLNLSMDEADAVGKALVSCLMG